jgi:conjugative relaxase-like TrwC/TraI family protein
MLIATQSQSIEGAAKYFDTVLSVGDYYTGVEVAATWRGKAAEVLGLDAGARVTREAFKALLSGRHPVTCTKLTQRVRKDRRPGVDLTFSVPKSVSLAWAINGDERLLDALREAVLETMAKDVEPLVARRVRKGEYAATKQRKRTGNLVYADFLHKTSRPVDGKVDPHLHVHAFVLNYTSDEGEHYAAELEEIFRQRASLQAKFDARLARRLQAVEGYAVEPVRFRQSGKLKAGWELRGIDRSTIEKFSARTRQIEEFAIEHDIREAAEKGKLGAKTRERKTEGASVEALRIEWRSRLTPEEEAAFKAIHQAVEAGGVKAAKADIEADIKAAVRY